ncbi:hypothetical protein LTR66_017148 [Elasticomyces elasticus]|nr:hypothetical protein LTR66_017148 [Elasticomyces elasticus]
MAKVAVAFTRPPFEAGAKPAFSMATLMSNDPVAVSNTLSANPTSPEPLSLFKPQPKTDSLSSIASAGNGITPDKSLSSVGSRTGLLDSSKQNKATASGSAMSFDEPQPPARKQRRVPDPYAIDDDDDDELLEELLELEENPKPKRDEESLMDFLRNAPPPPSTEQPPQPFVSTSNGSGASGMKARLLRSSQNSLRPQNTPTRAPSSYSAKVGQERNHGSMPNASNRKTDTSDLADFLRNSEPPRPPQPAPKQKDTGGFTRFFTRRKKTEA